MKKNSTGATRAKSAAVDAIALNSVGETFTIILPIASARRLRFIAAEEGKTPEAFASGVVVQMSINAMEGLVPNDEKMDAESAMARALNTPKWGRANA